MRVRIGTKLFAGFMLLVLMIVALSFYSINISQEFLRQSVGKSSIFLAEEILKRIYQDIYYKIEALQTHSKHLLLQETLSESNSEFEKIDGIEVYINQKEKEWVSASKGEITPFMQGLITNALSNSLREEFVNFYENKYGYQTFVELFATNKYGANVAQTGKTSDYRQDDEKWWQIAREERYYVSDIEYDESTATFAIPIGVRVDDEEGDFIGVMKAVIAFRGIIKEAEIGTKKYETTGIKIITKDGKLIYRTTAFKFLEDVSDKSYFKQIKGESGFFIAKKGGKERLYSYVLSKGYRDFEGLGWILVVGHDVQEILKPAFQLRNRMAAASLILIIIGIIIAFFMARSITKPIAELSKDVEIIGKGDLEHRVEVKTRDEIGELSTTFNQMTENLRKISASRDELNKEIGERKQAEEALKQTMAELKRSNEDLEQFAYVASHDLQEPLRMVSSYTQLLEQRYKDKLDADANDFIAYAVDGAKRMQMLIQDLLAYSRVGTRGKSFEATDCNSVLGQARVNLSMALEETGAVVTNDELPTIMVDETQLIQVFQNLIGNAIRFRSEEPLHVHILAEQKRNEWVFSVRDNGVGIDPEYHERIFIIFQRLQGKTEDAGTGIGLALCKKIVQRHGGRIWVESELGKGATFFFTLQGKRI